MGTSTVHEMRVEALEVVVDLLSRVEEGDSSDRFYGRLCEAVCRLTTMDRAIIFRYDETLGRVRAAGAFGIDLGLFADARVTVDSAPVAKRSLEEDRVIEISPDAESDVPPRYRSLLRDGTMVCAPISASGRWMGVILADRPPDLEPVSDSERELLWTLGKMAALATFARIATAEQQMARQLRERIDLARDIHESVIQRLFGVLLAFSSDAELDREARERCATELQAALSDLRRALQRPLSRSPRTTLTTLRAEIERLQSTYPELSITLAPGCEEIAVPEPLEPLAQSVLAEAVRNAHKHASPTRVEVALSSPPGAWVMEVVNDGVDGHSRAAGMGLRLAALDALQAGGLVEFGEREPGTWRVSLAVPV
jgi:signal transduction histidine kinase